MNLICDISRQALLEDYNGGVATLPAVFRGDRHTLTLALLSGGLPVDPAGLNVKVGIGLGTDTVPPEGRIKLDLLGGETGWIDYTGGVYPTPAAIKAALDALPEVVAAGGLSSLISDFPGSYRLTFTEPGERALIGATGYFLPYGQIIPGYNRIGDENSTCVQYFQLVSGPFAVATAFEASTPVHSFTETTPGVYTLQLPKSTLSASVTWTGAGAFGLGASADDVKTALAYASIIASVTAVDERTWLIYGPEDLDPPSVQLRAADILTGELRLDTAALSSALGGLPSITAVLEIEITSATELITAVQAPVRINRTVLDNPAIPAGSDVSLYMLVSTYDNDADGVVDLSAAVRKTGGSLTGDQIETLLAGKATTGSVTAVESSVSALDAATAKKAANLSDLANKAEAVTNLTTGYNNPSTAYTLLASDSGKIIKFTGATAVALTVNAASLPDGFSCSGIQQGAGQVTVSSAGVQSAGNRYKTAEQYAAFTICKIAGDVNLAGNLTA